MLQFHWLLQSYIHATSTGKLGAFAKLLICQEKITSSIFNVILKSKVSFTYKKSHLDFMIMEFLHQIAYCVG